jgi:hypothetical protein
MVRQGMKRSLSALIAPIRASRQKLRARRCELGSGSLPFNPISGTSYKGINLILCGKVMGGPTLDDVQTSARESPNSLDVSGRCHGLGWLGRRLGTNGLRMTVGRVRYQRNRDAGAQWRFQKVVAWLTSLSHPRLPLPFVTGFVVLQPSGVELVFFPCRDVVEGPAVAGSLQWVHDPTIGCVLFECTPE